jgi:hypothetical protein
MYNISETYIPLSICATCVGKWRRCKGQINVIIFLKTGAKRQELTAGT